MKERSVKEIKLAIKENLKRYDRLLQLESDQTVQFKGKTLSQADALEENDLELDLLMQEFAIAKDKENDPLQEFL